MTSITSPEFISEPITPDPGSFATAGMVQGLAGMPTGFTWRGDHYGIIECLEHSKRSAREGHTAGGELYLRRQEFLVRLDDGRRATLYVERQARGRSRQRWFLYTISADPLARDSEPSPGGNGP
ncbi:MAG: hypothetical protein HKO59_08265 [Phycisphaerales bacterium]|nr:hypothetical protein [Phycisphaerales bacterium]